MGNSSAKFEVPESPKPDALPGSAEELEKLKSAVKHLHMPGSAEYDRARVEKTWQKDHNSFANPSAIVSASSAEEVLAAVRFAMATGVKIQAACGRHTHECMVQNSLCIDLSSYMNYVDVDPQKKTVRVGGGARIGDVDMACKPHNFIIPVGRAPTTGCAGQMIYTGAHGYNERMHGLGIDYMTSATVVVARNGGEIVTCSADNEPELFWAVRGGGPKFCIICEMTFRPIEAPNNGQYAAGQRVYLPTGFSLLGMPTRQKVMDVVVKEFDLTKPNEYGVSLTMLGGGSKTVPSIVTEFWFGSNPDEGLKYFKDHKVSAGTAVADTYGVHDYWTGIQRWANGPKGEDAAPGCYYFRGLMSKVLTPEMGKVMADSLDKTVPTGVQPVLLVDMMGGGKSQDPELSAATSLPSRPNYWIILLCNWKPEVTGPAGREASVEWVRDVWKKLFELSAAAEGDGNVQLDSHSHVEELLEDTLQMGQQAKISRVYGESTERLQAVKTSFDPNNVFGKGYI